MRQKCNVDNSSANESDRYEELLVNPTMLKLATQRGNIDCGGLHYIVNRYGHFYQLIRSIKDGHISICLTLESNINELPNLIFGFLEDRYPDL